MRDLRVASYWIDTLVLKNWGKYLRYCAASSSPLWGKPTQAQDVAPYGVHFSLQTHIFFHHWFFGTWKYITKILTRKTRTTRIHFRRYPTSITAPVSWISAFSIHSLLICGGSILRASFFFECKEVDVSILYSSTPSGPFFSASKQQHAYQVGVSTSALISSIASVLAKSDWTSTKLRSINILLYSSSQYQNLHPFYTIKF